MELTGNVNFHVNTNFCALSKNGRCRLHWYM